MKTSRVLLVAVPLGALAVGAVALGMWSFRNVLSPTATASTGEKTHVKKDGANAPDGPRVIAGSPEEVAEVAQAMAEEGGAVLVTEVTSIGEGDTLVMKSLLIPDPEHATKS